MSTFKNIRIRVFTIIPFIFLCALFHIIPFSNSLNLFPLFATQASAAIYYVDATNGRDANTGLSETNAWKTIAKVNASSFEPGDQILFKRGEIWREQLIVPSAGTYVSNILFGSYGIGPNPVISAADRLVNWSTELGASNTVYFTSCQSKPAAVYEDNQFLVENAGPFLRS